MNGRPGSGKKVSRPEALGIAFVFAGVVAAFVWFVGVDAKLTMGDIAISVLLGGAVGLILAIILIVLAMSRFRDSISRMRTPSALLLGGLGFWAWLILEPTEQIVFVVGLTSTVYFLAVLAWVFDPWHTRGSEQQKH